LKFKFRFHSVLKQRKILRDMALRDFSLAEAEVKKQVELINVLYDGIDMARQSASKNLPDGSVELSKLGQIEDFIRLQLIRIDQERQKARELLAIMEEKQEILAELGKSLKAVETLKENESRKFKEEISRKEQIELDDMWMTRIRAKE
jgi:flagellar export protein FliJ